LPIGNKNHFELLKQKIVATMQQSYPGINPAIEDWKGQEITDFQEELLKSVNAHISEKWFYNHIKKKNQTLPRIDVLNLLSKYAGYANWDDFIYKNGGKDFDMVPVKTRGNRYFLIVPAVMMVVVAVLFGLYRIVSMGNFNFTFYDAVTKEVITGSRIELKVLKTNETPVNYFTDSTGHFTLRTSERHLKMVVSAPYYKTDTISRTLKSFDREQKISLHADDYALMVRYFSEMNVDDWQKRRNNLDMIFDDGAMIYQVMGRIKETGMELYNKKEFIDKLTMPTGSLTNLDILETRLKDDKIVLLKFRVGK
jgi:hypothetical protein